MANVGAVISSIRNIMRQDRGISGDAQRLEQLGWMLFLKILDDKDQELEMIKDKYLSVVPYRFRWRNWAADAEGITGDELLKFIDSTDESNKGLFASLRDLKDPTHPKRAAIVKEVFDGSNNFMKSGYEMRKVINKLNEIDFNNSEDKHIFGNIYESILQELRDAGNKGEYYTPRAVTQLMTQLTDPKLGEKILDPAAGTGGFLTAAIDYVINHHSLDSDQKKFLKNSTFSGNEIVAGTRRLCLMNMFLHNIGEIDGETFISPNDALIADEGIRVDYVLANPPFGKKSSMTITNEEGEQEKQDLSYNRQDFWASTSNKQLNFLQHIRSLMKITGEAAVVLPDNVLFEGGAGETVRKELLKTTELHTILRLPTGIFYANGVKANVLFFDNKPASKEAWTKDVWIYDYRTNIHHTLKKGTMQLEDLRDFITLYNPSNRHKRSETFIDSNPDGRWRKFGYEEIFARDKTNLDIFWLKDKSLADLDNLPDPDDLALEILEDVEAALDGFRGIVGILNTNN